jgi:hypothetical protein
MFDRSADIPGRLTTQALLKKRRAAASKSSQQFEWMPVREEKQLRKRPELLQ